MAIVTFWKQKSGDKWLVFRRDESPEEATLTETVEAEFESDQEAEAEELVKSLRNQNRIVDAEGGEPASQDG